MAKFSMDDYVDVAERIQDFKDAHPEGSLQTLGWEVREVGNQTFVVYRAAAYRTPEDPTPGHGIAWEPFPGKTPYTKDSELMNAETAAWGRAIVALGLTANRKLASRQEVRARVEDQAAEDAKAPAKTPRAKMGAAAATAPEPAKSDKADDAAAPIGSDVLDKLRAQFEKSEWSEDKLKWALVDVGADPNAGLPVAMAALSLDQAVKLMESMGGKADDLA